MKKICITGGAGMIGSHLLKKLVTDGYHVVVIDNLWRGKLSYIEEIEGFNVNRDFHNLDLSDPKNKPDVIHILEGCFAVFHLADIVAGIEYVFNNQYDIFKINNEINSLVFSCCELASVNKIIYAGTVCSFPKDCQMSLDSVLREEMLFPAEPESAYGWSKLMGTLELNYLSEKSNSKIESTTIMFHNVYGPNCDIDPSRSQVIPSIIRRIYELKDGETLTVWGNGEQGRAFIHVDDVVNGLVLALNKSHLPNIIQIGPSKCTSINELTGILLREVFHKEVVVHHDLTKPHGDLGRYADYSLAQKVLGWEPRVDIVSGLRQTADWILDRLNNTI